MMRILDTMMHKKKKGEEEQKTVDGFDVGVRLFSGDFPSRLSVPELLGPRPGGGPTLVQQAVSDPALLVSDRFPLTRQQQEPSNTLDFGTIQEI